MEQAVRGSRATLVIVIATWRERVRGRGQVGKIANRDDEVASPENGCIRCRRSDGLLAAVGDRTPRARIDFLGSRGGVDGDLLRAQLTDEPHICS